MLPLFDMLANAQNGQGMDLLARQFGLSQQQTQLAVEALLPAFSPGPEAQRSRPLWHRRLHDCAGDRPARQIFRRCAEAPSRRRACRGQRHSRPSVRLEGPVARRGEPGRAGDRHRPAGAAADAAGDRLDGDGRAVQAVDKPDAGAQAAGFGGASNPLGEIIEQMMRQAAACGGASRSKQAPQAGQSVRQPVRQDAEGHVRRRRGAAAAAAAAAPEAESVRQDARGHAWRRPAMPHRRSRSLRQRQSVGKILEEMMRGGGPAAPEPERQAPPQPRANPSGRAKNPYDDIFGKMFESGGKTRDEYQKRHWSRSSTSSPRAWTGIGKSFSRKQKCPVLAGPGNVQAAGGNRRVGGACSNLVASAATKVQSAMTPDQATRRAMSSMRRRRRTTEPRCAVGSMPKGGSTGDVEVGASQADIGKLGVGHFAKAVELRGGFSSARIETRYRVHDARRKCRTRCGVHVSEAWVSVVMSVSFKIRTKAAFRKTAGRCGFGRTRLSSC